MISLVQLLMRDGLKVANLERIYTSSRETRSLIDAALGAMRQLDSDLAWRATWILKCAAIDGRLSSEDVTRIATYAEELPHWASRLVVCQLLAATGCPEPARETVFPYLLECFADRRPIVRAWALSVMVGFEDDARYQGTIDACVQQARADPTPSVQARLRRLGKVERAKAQERTRPRPRHPRAGK